MLKNKVYNNLKKVPKGKVTTYKGLADSVNSKAYRYIGYLMKTNPDTPEAPCHRVISSDLKVGGYSGKEGVKGKIKLLKKEGIEIINNKIPKEFLYEFK